jgi:hypothetical protein
MLSSDHFFVTLPSNACMHIFAQNTGGYYKTLLPQELDLDSSWEVGLSEIIYVSDSWNNVRVGENDISMTIDSADNVITRRNFIELGDSDNIVIHSTVMAEKFPGMDFYLQGFVSGPDPIDKTIDVPKRLVLWSNNKQTLFYKFDQLLQEINDSITSRLTAMKENTNFEVQFIKHAGIKRKGEIQIKKLTNTVTSLTLVWNQNFAKLFNLVDNNKTFLKHIETSVTQNLPFEMFNIAVNCFDKVDKLTAYVEPKNYDSILDLINQINTTIFEKAPHSKDLTKFVYDSNINRVHWACLTDALDNMKLVLSPTLLKMLGYNEMEILTPKNGNHTTITAKNAPNLKFTLPTFWLYANIVTPISVGHQLVNLLRIVPVESNLGGRTIIKSYERPHFVNLAMNHISMIEIMINTAYGMAPVDFKDHVIVKLQFRKKRSIQL